jgi:hypothetical protein
MRVTPFFPSPVIALSAAVLVLSAGQVAAQKMDTSPQAMKQIDLQLKAIVSGLKQEVGIRQADGSVIRMAELEGRIIRMKVQMPYPLQDSRARSDFIDRRRIMQREFCKGETAKLIPYGVGWEYEYVDAQGRIITTFRITDCG